MSTRIGYGSALPMTSSQSAHMVLSDGPGTFYMLPNGDIQVIAGYPNAGTKFTRGTAQWNQVVKNLAAVGANQAKMDAYLGMTVVQDALKAPVLASTSGGSASMTDVTNGDVETPGITSHPMFWPGVAGLGLVAVGMGVLLFWPDE